MLGVHYVKGLGVKRDYIRAYAWLSLTNDAGDEHVRETLTRVRDKLSEGQISEAEVVIGELDEPVGNAFATLIGDQVKGHTRVLAIMNTDIMVKSATLYLGNRH